MTPAEVRRLESFPQLPKVQNKMDKLENARTAYNESLESRVSVLDEIEKMDPETTALEDVAALDSKLDEADAEIQRCKSNLDRVERVKKAREESPIIVNPSGSETSSTSISVGDEPTTYARTRDEYQQRVRQGKQDTFFLDMFKSGETNDSAARDRMQRHDREARDLTSTDTAGGDFIPPLWLMDEWLKLARASRPFADAVNHIPLPEKTDTINLPKVSTGTAVAAQTDGNAVQETDAVTDYVTAAVQTVAGMQDVSRQLLDRSIPGIDQVIFDDLSRAYASKLDYLCLNGSVSNAKGLLQTSSTNTVTYTDASPTVGEFVLKLADAIQQIHTNRFEAPDLIVMHPRRWGWISGSSDTTGRPLVTPYAPFNVSARFDRVASEAIVGNMMGLPVLIDSQIPTTNGASTTEDVVAVTRASDLYLWESPGGGVEYRTFEDVLSGTLQVRFRIHGYYGFMTNRYLKSTTLISGTGLINPF